MILKFNITSDWQHFEKEMFYAEGHCIYLLFKTTLNYSTGISTSLSTSVMPKDDGCKSQIVQIVQNCTQLLILFTIVNIP